MPRAGPWYTVARSLVERPCNPAWGQSRGTFTTPSHNSQPQLPATVLTAMSLDLTILDISPLRSRVNELRRYL